MMQLIKRNPVPVRFGAITAVVVLAACLITGGPVVAIATSEPDTRGTLPVGAALPSDDDCAGYANSVGSGHEARPENTDANQSVPANLNLPPWPDFWASSANRLFVPRIDGQYTGTTDQILVWGACKWGIDSDVVRAMAMEESSWRQTHVGDFVSDPSLCVGGHSNPCPTSFGILQLKHFTRPGSWPNSQEHTAFNVDYSLAVLRGCFEGWVTYLHNGYGAGDLWGCVGWHYSGEWKNNEALAYIGRVRHHLDERSWTSL
jgi:autotransporter family porin